MTYFEAADNWGKYKLTDKHYKRTDTNAGFSTFIENCQNFAINLHRIHASLRIELFADPNTKSQLWQIKNNLWHEFENNSILSVGKFLKNGKEKGIL